MRWWTQLARKMFKSQKCSLRLQSQQKSETCFGSFGRPKTCEGKVSGSSQAMLQQQELASLQSEVPPYLRSR